MLKIDKRPLFLYCSRSIVNSYLKKYSGNYENEIVNYVGKFASFKDLEKNSRNSLVFYGNHLYNHDVPLLLSDSEFTDSYIQNQKLLNVYKNSIDLFAFPFGQPLTCYSQKQIDLLKQLKALKVFNSCGNINKNIDSYLLHRVSLDSFHSNSHRIWFQVFNKEIRNKLKNIYKL